MPKVTVITLTAEERAALEKAAKYGTTPSYRLRCQAILLKTERPRSAPRWTSPSDSAAARCRSTTGSSSTRQQGLAGLKTKTGRGRKAILQTETDLAAVRQAVQNSRQRISLAKAELEQELGKEFSAPDAEAVPEKNGCRYKRIRRGVKREPNADVYALKRECLAEYRGPGRAGAD